MTESCNIAAALPRLAAEHPDRIAIRCPGRRGADGLARYDLALTHAQLDARSDAIAAGLARHGVVRGSRAVVMVRPTPEFFLLMFALFKAGAVPVLVDPGIDRRALRQCLDEAQPQAFIGIPLAHLARRLLGWARSARIHVTTGRYAWPGEVTLARAERDGEGSGPQLAATAPDDVAAILFTSGSTGVPKGVVYRHRHFVAQVAMLGEAFGITSSASGTGGVNLPTFPPFALFDPALGVTSVIPDMDPTRPASADPRKLHDAIARFGVDQLFGSPALMAVLARCGQPLPTIRRVMSAGAPVPAEVVATLRGLLPDDAQFWTPYGATECLPVALIEGRELQATREATERGAGTCVGRPVAPNVVRIIRIDDAAIERWSDDLCVADGEVGEITVAGPTATDGYFNRDAQTRLAKIEELALTPTLSREREREREQKQGYEQGQGQGQGAAVVPPLPLAGEGRGEGPSAGGHATRTVHRMGDLGYFDAEGRLWFCGRKSHRVESAAGLLYTEQVEPVFNVHPQVRRTALVGVGERGMQIPVLCVELAEGVATREWPRIESELRAIAGQHPRTAGIVRFLRHKRFPVDIRHNAKIGREKLAAWAAKQLGSL
ncbi:fatty acid CoA ligase family protein [Lysobacter sp. F60174L2]|uniref:fatty acid CoA ligase family protein n=1 Tax=Lysobacter sp. F60174L2 TaxID=3459295 RepID=UPI00403D8558